MTWVIDLCLPPGSPGEIRHSAAGGTAVVAGLADLAAAAAGRTLVLITHGFNVGPIEAVAQLQATAASMALPPTHVAAVVIWPGSFAVPVVNYPFEHKDAVAAGQRLARLITHLPRVSGIAAFSHSLGARVMLELARHAPRPLQLLCLTAAAADDDLFRPAGQYGDVITRTNRVVVVHSRSDLVLRITYPVGDFLSDLFLGDSDSFKAAALGYGGPRPVAGSVPREIPRVLNHGHGDYIGPSDKGDKVATLFRDYLMTGQSSWPPPPEPTPKPLPLWWAWRGSGRR